MVHAQAIAQALRPDTRLVILIHASNVTGALQPVADVAALLRQRPTRLLVDAAQSVGHLPLDVRQLGCDFLAAPGHKGLLGPLGTGFLYVAPGRDEELQPIRLGGTGTQSDADEQPRELPVRYEAGNLNLPGLLGLGQGIRYLLEHGVDAVAQHERQLTAELWEAAAQIPGITQYGPSSPRRRTSVVSLNLAGHPPQELALLLDQIASIQVRAGFHCAPQIHRSLKTHQGGGTLRVSIGPFNKSEEIATLVRTLREISEAASI